ncbi:MobH family relaxase [Burkholderia cenocepacia]|uniref:MobH family relaxase n=1 Tax=Burkholderia cenocepacia TaxID=95486 RepID=UPI0024B64965|nr:MobH family relaxase [Burkholderia cenocepacia]MDI9689984.1 MobH family relaxase [Burkholderia cenocepacia]
MSVDSISQPSGDGAHPAEFRYPSVDPGIPALEVDALLDAHRELIDRIKLCFGMDRADFEQSVRPLLRRYASFVHLLPCTADNYFNEPGGLLRIGLEAAFYALQGTDAHIFSGRATITERRNLEPRWRQATFIAGLCCELHRPLSHLIVTDEAGNEWSPYLGPLIDWLKVHHVARYFLKWRPNALESRSLGLFALPHVVAPEVLQDLASGNTQIVSHLLATIAGLPIYRDHNVLETLVRRALALVIDRFLLASAERYGKPQLGSHLERYLVDALRRLIVANASWTPNTDKSRVWYGTDGMFLVWPSAADDVRKLLEADQLPGIPKAPETILEVLLTAGVLSAHEDGKATWLIHPPTSKGSLEAVKLSAPAILYAELDKLPAALPAALLTPPASPSAPTASPAPSSPQGPPLPARRRVRTAPSDVVEPQADALPEQLPLSVSPPSAPSDEGPTAATSEPAVPSGVPSHSPPTLPKLLAPFRLPPIVRDALQDIVATLGSAEAGWWAAMPAEDGLFVPLASLTTRKLTPPAAIRAMNEAGMLALPSPLTRSFQGQEVVGVLLAARHVQDMPKAAASGDQ